MQQHRVINPTNARDVEAHVGATVEVIREVPPPDAEVRGLYEVRVVSSGATLQVFGDELDPTPPGYGDWPD